MANTMMTTSGNEDFYNQSEVEASAAIPQALIFTASNVMGNIDGDAPSLNVAYISTPAAAAIVAEGEEITAANTQLTTVRVHTRKIATLQLMSNETKGSQPIVSMLSDGLIRQVTAKADAIFLQNTAKTDDDATPVGIFARTDLTDGGTITTTLDPIVTAMAAVSTAGGTPTHIIMSYGTWAKLLLLKYTDGRPMIAPTVADSPTPILFGVPVILNNQAPADKIAIIDRNEIVSAVGTVNLAKSEDRYFEKDSYGVRVTFRSGWNIIHPTRLATIAVNTTAASDKTK